MWKVKYFDGEKAQAILAQVKIQDDILLIQTESGVVLDHWIISDIQFDPNHLDRKFLMVPHELNARIEVLDDELIRALPELKPNKLEAFFTTKTIIVFGILLIALLALFVFAGSKRMSHFLASKISIETEKRLAGKIEFEKYFDICPRSVVEQDLNLELQRLTEKDSEFQNIIGGIRMIDYPQPNAFTLPGGHIFISYELIRQADSYEEVIGVLAHEAGHYKRRHVLQGLIRGSLLTVALNFFSGDFSNFVLIDPTTLSRVAGLQFDRELEHEADMTAVEILQKTGLGTNGLIQFFEKIKKENSRLKIPEFISTHPSDQNRIQYLEKYKSNTKLHALPKDLKMYACHPKPY